MTGTSVVWITTGQTESGDEIGPYPWAREPTEEEVETFLKEQFPAEFEEVGFVHHKTKAVPLIF